MTSRPRPSHLRDDLLADLRQVTPPPAAAQSPAAEAPQPSAPAGLASPSIDVDVRISRQAWSFPSLQPAPGGAGLVISGGPLRVRLGLSRG
jgi:hypothetical protein